jgi:hypothetical protein
VKFSDQLEQRFARMLTLYPVKRSVLVPMLLYMQDELGYLSDEAMREIGQRLDLSELEVRNVASYYSMLRFKPMGRYHVQVCTNISCMLRGAEEVFDRCRAASVSDTSRPRPTASFLSRKSSASARAVGRRRHRSTTRSTKSLRPKRWTKCWKTIGRRQSEADDGFSITNRKSPITNLPWLTWFPIPTR